MKQNLALAVFILLAAGCGDDKNNCPRPVFTVAASGSNAIIQESTGSTYGFLEIEYGSNGFSRGSGTTVTISASHSLTNLANGTYDIYMRGNCGGGAWSDWTLPESFIITGGISGNCSQPIYLDYGSYGFRYVNWYSSVTHNYWEVEYGTTGFTLGSGTRVTAGDDYYQLGSLTPGLVYDFYVRANCGGQDWSVWAGPHSFVAE